MTRTESAKSIKLVIDSNLDVVFLVSLAVRAICSYELLGEEAVYQVELSLVEAVNNAIKHAYGNEKGHEVEIIIALHPDKLTLRVCDTGRALNPSQIPTLDFDPGDLDALPEAGMGFHIMRSVMDRVEYRRSDNRNVLTLIKFLKKQ